jgi:ribonuclease P protein component
MISYIGREEIKFEDLYLKMEKLLTLFVEKVKNTPDENIPA